jgi:hypothetical protein
MITRFAPLALVFFLAACGAPAPQKPAEFGKTCVDDSECVNGGGSCAEFGMPVVKQCTLACTSSSQCPSGTKGALCNNKGYCSP